MAAAHPNPVSTASLVRGSGGARGLAHIGVIQWLTTNGYDNGSQCVSTCKPLI